MLIRVASMPVRRTRKTRCLSCGRSLPDYEIINFVSPGAGCRSLCTKCANTEVAEAEGLSRFQHTEFAPVQIADCDGRRHTFHFRTHLFGPGVAIDAFELRNGSPRGYEFQVIGEPEEELLALLAKLIGKIRRALSVKHLAHDIHGLRIAEQVVRGRIAWDAVEQGSVPLLIIDGREVTWNELGTMLMTFEGWQFKIEIRDCSEEV
jgi:hypothetical protein